MRCASRSKRRDGDRAGEPPHHIPIARPAHRRDESLPLRPRRRAGLCLPPGKRPAPSATRRASPAPCSTASTSRSRFRAVSAADLVLPQASEGSAEMRERVSLGAPHPDRALRRAQVLPASRTNADCDGALLEEIAAPDRGRAHLLREAADALSLSARGYHRTLRVARTLADLDGEAKRRPHPCRRGARAIAARRSAAPRKPPKGCALRQNRELQLDYFKAAVRQQSCVPLATPRSISALVRYGER